MTKAKHTSGPWTVPEKFPSEVERSDGKTVASCWHQHAVGKTVTLEDVAPVSLSESRANARLIAAAPELLEALERILGAMPFGDEPDFAVAAINKAKGK